MAPDEPIRLQWHINIDTMKIKILSIPRDTRSKFLDTAGRRSTIPFFRWKDLLSTIINYLGMPIDYFVVSTTYFSALASWDGIDILVKRDSIYVDSAGGFTLIFRRAAHLVGKRALITSLSQRRKETSGRVKRQQRFMAALLENVKMPVITTNYLKLLRKYQLISRRT
jgi:anionic cell wall polymer biosynthesis LytR-Cps2A-Psr (LCP) family protein